MSNETAAKVLGARALYMESNPPDHPAVKSGWREEVYALRLAVTALNQLPDGIENGRFAIPDMCRLPQGAIPFAENSETPEGKP